MNRQPVPKWMKITLSLLIIATIIAIWHTTDLAIVTVLLIILWRPVLVPVGVIALVVFSYWHYRVSRRNQARNKNAPHKPVYLILVIGCLLTLVAMIAAVQQFVAMISGHSSSADIIFYLTEAALGVLLIRIAR